jgi:hypothetical protein
MDPKEEFRSEQMIPSHLLKSVILVWFSVSVVGCATIREVKKTPGKGGVITVQEGIGGDARSMAKQKMKENCGSKAPVVTEEGEAVIGTESQTYSSTTESEDKREWRVSYRCKGSKGRKSASLSNN